MGDMFSTKKNTTNNQTFNNQIGQQGRNQLGVSGTVAGNITVENSDPEVVQSALNTVNGAIEGMGRATQNNAVVSAAAIDLSRDVSSRALDLGNTAILSSGVALVKTLDFLDAAQARGMQTVDNAVAAAQNTALLATPQSPAAYAEISKGQDNTKLLTLGLLGIGGLFALTMLPKLSKATA